MKLYFALFGCALIPVLFSFLFSFLEKKTRFPNLPYWLKQLIIGCSFGIAAILGTELGVDIGGATANTRDAAPLCAGLLFGGPAGIIAGLIGGIERWFAASWGAGTYSMVACSVSTVLAGIFAAFLRKHLFDDKRPTAGFGIITTIVMEVVHLSLLFATHLSDSMNAYRIVKLITIPMICFNALSVAVSSLVFMVFEKNSKKGNQEIASIARKVQSRMLLCVVLAYLVTTGFVYILQTNSAYLQSKTILSLNLEDTASELEGQIDYSILEVTRNIAAEIETEPGIDLKTLADTFGVSEINLVNEIGIITDSTDPRFIDYNMYSGVQSRAFMVLTAGTNEFIQKYQKISYEDGSTSDYRKYAGCILVSGGFVQVGLDPELYHRKVSEQVRNITNSRHVGENGYILIANQDGIIITEDSENKDSLDSVGIVKQQNSKPYTRYSSKVKGVPSFWMYAEKDEVDIFAVLSSEEAFSTRDEAVYVNSFMEVLVFALLFALIYSLIKKLVVNNIRSVNKNLEQIIGGDLSVEVDVRSSSEFSSLSDDINSTVTTLKHYIAEASARIDKELEFAKTIQSSALPSVFPAFPQMKTFDIFASMTTAKEVGGDFYDFYLLDQDKLAFLIADVSGKGIPAAMFMMRAKTMLKNYAEENLPVHEILTRANEKLCEGNDAGMFVTAWMGILECSTGHLTYANAGHNPPLVKQNGKGFAYLHSRPGFVLAGMEGIKYKIQEMDLNPGDRIFLYTDGVTEATNAEQKLYGEDRLLKFLNEHQELSLEQTLTSLKGDIDQFVGEAEQFDDITMVILDYKGSNSVKNMTEKVFPADTDKLKDVTAFLETELEKVDCGMKTAMQISVALEEMFVNVANYAYPEQKGEVTVGISADEHKITICLTDQGIPFNPLKKDDPDVSLPAEEREIGGLGIFMVKKTMDEVSYENKEGKNIFTMSKNI